MLALCTWATQSACAARREAEGPQPALIDDPFTFASLTSITPDFAVKQQIAWQGHGHDGSFDAVLQKHGPELTIVGLGPVGIRAFVLKQSDSAFTFEQSLGPKLPFSPRNIAVDVHRAYFKRLPPPAAHFSGELQGDLDGEHVHEVWQDGELQARSFSVNDPARPGLLRIVYGKGCTAVQCLPVRVQIESEWRNYKLDIRGADYTLL